MVVNLRGKPPMQPLGSELNRGQWVLNFMSDATRHFAPGLHTLDTNNLRYIFKKADNPLHLAMITRQRCARDQHQKTLSFSIQT